VQKEAMEEAEDIDVEDILGTEEIEGLIG